MAIPFSYATFWRWFRDDPAHILTPTTDVFVTVYSIDHPAIKYASSRAETPFLTRNMRALRVTDGDAITTHFPNGLFAVMETAAFGDSDDKARVKALRKKNLFIVFPKIVQHEDAPLIIADHYSCLVDDGGRRGTPFHFHLTQYFPAEGRFGAVLVEDNYMPLNFTLPADDDAFRAMLTNERMQAHHAPAIRSVFSRPWAEPAAQTGGGHAARLRRQRRRAIVAPDASFDDLWRTLPLSRITVFGIAAGSGYDVTVFLTDRLRHVSGNRRGYAFHVEQPATIPATIARLMRGLTWDAFADRPDEE